MTARIQISSLSLAPCRSCSKPVAAPVGLLDRELFRVSRCPHCGVHFPHPDEVQQLAHTRRTALVAALCLAASLATLLAGPMDVLVQRLQAVGY